MKTCSSQPCACRLISAGEAIRYRPTLRNRQLEERLISHTGSRPKASTGCSPPPLSGCDPDKLKDRDRTKSKIQDGAPPRRWTPLNGWARPLVRPLAQKLRAEPDPRGIPQLKNSKLDGGAEPRLTPGGEAAAVQPNKCSSL